MYLYFQYTTWVIAFILAPLLYLISIRLRNRHKGVILTWKKPQIVVFTIATFVLNLTLFIAACFFIACYFGSLNDVLEAFTVFTSVPSNLLKQMGLHCLLLMAGISVIFLAIQNFYTQYITREGIVYKNGIFNQKQPDIIYWHQIRDYYIQAKYPISYFNFIIQREEMNFYKSSVRVPFFARLQFETIIEIYLEKEKMIRAQARKAQLKNIS